MRDIKVTTYVTIIIASFLILPTYADKEHPYEKVDNICKDCTCIEKADNQPSKFYVLNCTSRNFSQILDGYPNLFQLDSGETMVDVIFSGNKISFLNQLPATDALMYFSCRHCGIKEIETGVFANVPSIYKVDLSWNALNDLRPEILKGRYSPTAYEPIPLAELDLGHNSLVTLDHGSFEHVLGLKTLNLEHNQLNLEDISTMAALVKLKHLEKLNLAYTGIETLPAEILTDRLIELNLYGNKLLTVPGSLPHASALTTLNIGGNLIPELNEGSFKEVKLLKRLYMSDMPSLQIIHANVFSNLTALEALHCCNNTNFTSMDIGSLSFSTLRTLDISGCSLKTLEITYKDADQSNDSNSSSLLFTNLQSLKIDNNPWHCNCSLFKTLQKLMKFDENDFQSENTARCLTPYELSSDLLVDITIDKLCKVSNNKKPRQPLYDPPPFLRPRSIVFSLLSILIVVLIGLCIGFAIVLIKKKLKQNDVGLSSPIRYTTVRNSTISVG
ncbi:Toll-like receptor Tollo [Pseudolycoriella hygida]|uniref:Toll-like receptor Tollo n=1 Tax=Pseudolycoriella hygida TaxID=35572 RepID=A0A9Q0MUE7_9DIPT|nr:Toll-like receptor Tollo [Pseudolycoriella hygida]